MPDVTITSKRAGVDTREPTGNPLLGAGVSLGGDMLSSAFNYFMAKDAQKNNRQMVNSAHQREVRDLRLAGLNPVLSANHSGSASLAAPVPHMESGIGSRAIQTAFQSKQLALLDAQTRDLNATANMKERDDTIGELTKDEKLFNVLDQYERYEVELAQLRKVNPKLFEEITEKVRGMSLENQHSAYGMDKAKSESKFYKGSGGDFEHWVKMITGSLPPIMPILMKGGKKASGARGFLYGVPSARDQVRDWKNIQKNKRRSLLSDFDLEMEGR